MQGSVNNFEIEGRKQIIVDSNTTWKTGLNKQGNIDLAIISQKSGLESKKSQNILDMVGDIGSISVTEQKTFQDFQENTQKNPDDQKDKKFFPVQQQQQLKENDNELTSNQGISQKDKDVLSSVFDNQSSSNNDLSNTNTNTNTNSNTNTNNRENSNSELNNFGLKQQGDINENEDSEQSNINKGTWNLKHRPSVIDNVADVSDFMKWKYNNRRTSLDQPMPDLSQVKSKINTGIIKMKQMDEAFQKENDDLREKFMSLQKEKEKQLQNYREMLLKGGTNDKIQTEDVS